MKQLTLTAFFLAAMSLPAIAIAQTAAPSAAPSTVPTMTAASPLPSADPAVMGRAKDVLHQAQTGQFDRSQLDDKMNAALTDTVVKSLSSQLGPLGDPTAFTLTVFATQDGYNVYLYKVAFKTITINEQLVIDPRTGKVVGLLFRPAQ